MILTVEIDYYYYYYTETKHNCFFLLSHIKFALNSIPNLYLLLANNINNNFSMNYKKISGND